MKGKPGSKQVFDPVRRNDGGETAVKQGGQRRRSRAWRIWNRHLSLQNNATQIHFRVQFLRDLQCKNPSRNLRDGDVAQKGELFLRRPC